MIERLGNDNSFLKKFDIEKHNQTKKRVVEFFEDCNGLQCYQGDEYLLESIVSFVMGQIEIVNEGERD